MRCRAGFAVACGIDLIARTWSLAPFSVFLALAGLGGDRGALGFLLLEAPDDLLRKKKGEDSWFLLAPFGFEQVLIAFPDFGS